MPAPATEMASQDVDDQRTVTESLPGYLPWEEDLEMVSKYLDRKVNCYLWTDF